MKILLLGDFSGLHYTLKDGLESHGHSVKLASDGDGWKNYPRDINIKWDGNFRYLKILKHFITNWKSYTNHDVVQLINPLAFSLNPARNLALFKFLTNNNGAVFLGANGTDMIYLDHAFKGHLKYSVYNNPNICEEKDLKSKIILSQNTSYRRLNEYIADKSKGISACCTEYKMAYDKHFAFKTKFIPLPINISKYSFINDYSLGNRIKFFLGIQTQRKYRKGMDVLQSVLNKLKDKYPNDVELKVAQNVPFSLYQEMLNSSNILCDQIYSYGLGMNGVMGLAKGLIVAGGGKPEMYHLFNEDKLHPIIDLPNDPDSVYLKLERLLSEKDTLQQRAIESRMFCEKHHCHIKIAKQYLDFWSESQ